MPLEELIKNLKQGRSALDEVIASLEAMRASPERNRPGRKSMSTEERRVVAERLKKYWAMRRQANLSTIHKEEYADGMHRSGSSGR